MNLVTEAFNLYTKLYELQGPTQNRANPSSTHMVQGPTQSQSQSKVGNLKCYFLNTV